MKESGSDIGADIRAGDVHARRLLRARGLGIDVSRRALRRCVGRHPRARRTAAGRVRAALRAGAREALRRGARLTAAAAADCAAASRRATACRD